MLVAFRSRIQLASGFRKIAEELKPNFRREGDVEPKLIDHKLLDPIRPENGVLQLRYDEMKNSYLEAVEVMWRCQVGRYVDPTCLLVAFEAAAQCQENYAESYNSAFNRAVHKNTRKR